ncbi:hypothetical protein AAHE18_05G127500 [Arachis hypogaea]
MESKTTPIIDQAKINGGGGEPSLCLSHTQSRALLIGLLVIRHSLPATACYCRRRNFQLQTATTFSLTSPPSCSGHRNLPNPPSRCSLANVEASIAQPRFCRRQLCSTVATVLFQSLFEVAPCLGLSLLHALFKTLRLLASRKQI